MELELTKTEHQIYEALRDGFPRSKVDLIEQLPDPEMTDTLRVHISHLRKKLAPRGLSVLCEVIHKKVHYRLVRYVTAGD